MIQMNITKTTAEYFAKIRPSGAISTIADAPVEGPAHLGLDKKATRKSKRGPKCK